MLISVKGTRNKRLIRDARSLTKFCTRYFLSKGVCEQLDITIVFDRDLKEVGTCMWVDSPTLPRRFEIELRPPKPKRLTRTQVLTTLAHECVHLKQFASNQLYDYERQPHLTRWKNKKTNTDKKSYWEYPWEIEAFGWELSLYKLWLHNKKRG